MKTEYNQFIHVEGDAHIYNQVGGNRAASEGFMGIVFGALGAMGAVGLLVAFVVHLLEMLTLWMAAHAVAIGTTGAIAAAGGYAVYRAKRRDHAKALVAANRCHGEQVSVVERSRNAETVAEPRHRLNRDIETISFIEKPADTEALEVRRTTNHRHE